jgi:O-antigen/teichoic acid export membrane protein
MAVASEVPPTRAPSLIKNALSNGTGFVANVLVAYLLTPYIIAAVGRTGYGVWALMLTVVGYAGVLDLGVGPAITHFVADRVSNGDWSGARRYIRGSLSLLSLAGLIFVTLGFFGAETLAGFLQVPATHWPEFVRLVPIVAVTAGVMLLSRLAEAVLAAYEMYPMQNAVKCAVALLRGAATWMVLFLGGGLIGLGYVMLTTTLLQLVLLAARAQRLSHGQVWSPFGAGRSVYWSLLTFGGAVTIISLADILRFRLGNLVAAKYLTFDDVGLFNIASLLAGYFITAVAVPAAVLLPRFSRLQAHGDIDGLQRLFLGSSRLNAIVASGFGLMLLVGGGPFLHIWLGGQYSSAQLATCHTTLDVLVATYIVVLSQANGVNLLYSMRRQRFLAALCMGEGVVVLLLSLWLVQWLGLTGLAVATALPVMLGKLLIQPIYVARLMEVSTAQYLGWCLAGSWFLCGGLYVAYRQVARWVPIDGWCGLLAYVAAAGLAFAGLGYVFLLGPQERAQLQRKMRRAVGLSTD